MTCSVTPRRMGLQHDERQLSDPLSDYAALPSGSFLRGGDSGRFLKKVSCRCSDRQPCPHSGHATARPVDHRLCARSLWSRLQPASASPLSLPRSGQCEAGQSGYPRKRSPPEGPRLGRWTDYCGPAKAGSGRDGRRGKSRKGGAGVQARGAGRCSRPKPRVSVVRQASETACLGESSRSCVAHRMTL